MSGVDGLDITLAAGELTVVTGPSLSGKTTLLHLLAGWMQPDSGRVDWGNGSTNPPPWSYLTVVPQGFALLGELSVAENVAMSRRVVHGDAVDREDRLDSLLSRLGLDHLRDRGAFETSVGERQRTMIARALLDQPPVILADEPVAHQDARHAQIVVDLLEEAVDAGASCLVATRSRDLTSHHDHVINLPVS